MIAAIDIGGTKIKYGVVDSSDDTFTFLGEMDTNTSLADFKMENRLDDVLEKIKATNPIEGIAISTAGIVDVTNGFILHANKNIPNYQGTPLKDSLENKYHVPVSVENDVNAALLGELTFGSFENIENAIMLTIGTGVGGAVYLNGKIFHGSSYSAGEVGYSLFNQKQIEETASTTALVRKVKNRLNLENINGYWIFNEAIHNKNVICIEEIDSMINDLVQLMINIVSLINPDVVILGGGIMEQTAYLEPRINQRFQQLYKNEFVLNQTQIKFASLGNHAGVLGAYSHYKSQYLG